MDEVYERQLRALASIANNTNKNLETLRQENAETQRQLQDLILRLTEAEKHIQRLRAEVTV